MPITDEQIKLLNAYRDRSYVSNVLCDQCADVYSFIKTLCNMPLIISSSLMTIFNSSFNADDMKISNVIINGLTALILSLISNFKLQEKQSNFKTIGIKFNKLCHNIEDKLTNDLDGITTDHIRHFINEYDSLNENLDYPYIGYIKERVIKKYKGVKALPNSCNCVNEITRRNLDGPSIASI